MKALRNVAISAAIAVASTLPLSTAQAWWGWGPFGGWGSGGFGFSFGGGFHGLGNSWYNPYWGGPWGYPYHGYGYGYGAPYMGYPYYPQVAATQPQEVDSQ